MVCICKVYEGTYACNLIYILYFFFLLSNALITPLTNSFQSTKKKSVCVCSFNQCILIFIWFFFFLRFFFVLIFLFSQKQNRRCKDTHYFHVYLQKKIKCNIFGWVSDLCACATWIHLIIIFYTLHAKEEPKYKEQETKALNVTWKWIQNMNTYFLFVCLANSETWLSGNFSNFLNAF